MPHDTRKEEAGVSGAKQFDVQGALTQIMDLFWRKGFEATSLANLESVTGLNRSSLYSTFGDKRAMFLAALDEYIRAVSGPTFEPLSQEDLCKAVTGMLELRALRMEDPTKPAGCLLTNTLAECGGHGDSIGRTLTATVSLCEARLYDAIRRAQVAGTVVTREDPRALARFFMGVSQAMALMSKASGDPSVARDIMRVAVTVLGDPPGTPLEPADRNASRVGVAHRRRA